ncbi:MAG: homocitrate synthase [Candidatus Adiutrix sp.]|jgi:isopropylmalate/homocitrate/citramalate synthase|nr:homocitrate synthase [Candidatus Adiutrix sp.]
MNDYSKLPAMTEPYFGPLHWTSPLNFMSEVKDLYPPKVDIYDVTLRDGEQTPGVIWKEDERVRLAEALAELGLRRLEVGMPVVNASIPRAIKKILSLNLPVELMTLCRTKEEDIDLSLDLGLKAVVVEHPINPWICRHSNGLDTPALLDRLIGSVAYAKEKGLYVNFFGWDAFRCELSYIQNIFGEVVRQARPDAVTVTDTFGVALPEAVKMTIRKIREVVDVPVEFHGHNEFGFGVGASLAAVEGGASCLHSAVNGLGERTGNVATEEIAMALQLLAGVETGLDMSRLSAVSRLCSEISKVPVPAKKPIVGPNLSKVESGLVTDVIYKFLKMGIPTGMSPFAPAMVGGDPVEFVIGKGSGKANINFYLEKHGVNPDEVTKDQMGDILEAVKSESYVRKASLSEKDLMAICSRIFGRPVE